MRWLDHDLVIIEATTNISKADNLIAIRHQLYRPEMRWISSFGRFANFRSEVCTGQVDIFEASDLIWLCEFHAYAFSIALIGFGYSELGQCDFSWIRLIPKLLALHGWEIETLQHMALINVSFQQFLVIWLVLVRHASLARHLCISMELLRYRCVILGMSLVHVL